MPIFQDKKYKCQHCKIKWTTNCVPDNLCLNCYEKKFQTQYRDLLSQQETFDVPGRNFEYERESIILNQMTWLWHSKYMMFCASVLCGAIRESFVECATATSIFGKLMGILVPNVLAHNWRVWIFSIEENNKLGAVWNTQREALFRVVGHIKGNPKFIEQLGMLGQEAQQMNDKISDLAQNERPPYMPSRVHVVGGLNVFQRDEALHVHQFHGAPPRAVPRAVGALMTQFSQIGTTESPSHEICDYGEKCTKPPALPGRQIFFTNQCGHTFHHVCLANAMSSGHRSADQSQDMAYRPYRGPICPIPGCNQPIKKSSIPGVPAATFLRSAVPSSAATATAAAENDDW